MSYSMVTELSSYVVQQPSIHPSLPETPDHLGILQTRVEPRILTEVPRPSAGGAPLSRQTRMRTRAIQEVVVIEVAGRLAEVVEDLDLEIEITLARGPRGVVCNLSAVLEDGRPGGVDDAGAIVVGVLASAGRHGRDWPGIPVAMACPDPQVRQALRAHPLGVHLIVTESLFSAMTAVLATPAPTVQSLRLPPHPTSPRAARAFVTRTLLDWRLGRAIPSATRVVSELVASSSVHAGTEIDLSVSWDLDAVRLTVRDHAPSGSVGRHTSPDLQGRWLGIVSGLSRTFGVLPAADGGKVVWAVLEAPRPRPSTRQLASESAITTQGPPGFSDGYRRAELPFSAGPGQPSP
jgi:hypothetical protein